LIGKLGEAIRHPGSPSTIHGPDNQHFASALEAFKAVKDRDTRLGVCIDVGHTVRFGEDPVTTIEHCASRLYDFHIK